MLIGWIIIDTDCQAWVRQQLVSPGHRCKERLTAAGPQKQNVELLTHRLKQATSVYYVQLSYHFQS